MKGKKGDQRWIDYLMSKEFGLDWKNYENERMSEFILIMMIENNLNNKEDGTDGHSPKNSSRRS